MALKKVKQEKALLECSDINTKLNGLTRFFCSCLFVPFFPERIQSVNHLVCHGYTSPSPTLSPSVLSVLRLTARKGAVGGATRWRSWWRHCTTSWEVAGSVPDVIGIFHWRNPSGRTMALGLTQPLIEMSSTNILWGWGVKAAGA